MKYWTDVQQAQSYLKGGRFLLALAGDLSSDGVTIRIPYGVDVLHRPA